MAKILIFIAIFSNLLQNQKAFSQTNNLVIPLAASNISLDPSKILDQSSLWISRQLNCQLVRHEGTEIINDAAKTIVFKNPKEIEITIKDNLKFSDGTELTSEDVAATFSFLREKRKIHRNVFQWVKYVNVINNKLITIHLNKAVPHFLKTLAAPTQSIFSKKFLKLAENNNEMWNSPIGCGSYKIKDRIKDDQNRELINLSPINKELREITFVLTGENTVQSREINQFDIIGLPVENNNIELEKNYSFVDIFDPYQIYFILNTKLKKWSKKTNRCDLLKSINFNDIKKIYKINSEIASDWFPRGILGYDKNSPFLSYKNNSNIKPNKKLNLSILSVSIPTYARSHYIEILKRNFHEVKIDIITNTKSFADDFLKVKSDAIIFGLKSGYLDGYEFIQFLSEPQANVTQWNDPIIKNLIRNGQNISDSIQRSKNYQKIAGLIYEQCLGRPIISIINKRVYYKKNITLPSIGKQGLDSYDIGKVR